MNKIYAIALLFPVLSPCAIADRGPVRRCYHSNVTFENEIGYCHALRVGDILYISGTAPDGPMPGVIRTTYTNLQKTLAASGLTFNDVVMERVYTTDLDTFIRYQKIRKEFYGKTFPAATWIQVQRLFDPANVLEIELQARYPTKQ